MTTQNLIIYKFNALYHILEELGLDLNIKVAFAENENSLNECIKNSKNYLIISNKKYLELGDKFILVNNPINIFKLIEKINIEFLKLQFNEKSKIDIGKYKIDLNSRHLISNDQKLKLTEKEADIIIYLYKSNSPVKINQLQKEVWGFKSKLETHTVETHIYRLRKKILEIFNDNDFIISKKNGYKIN